MKTNNQITIGQEVKFVNQTFAPSMYGGRFYNGKQIINATVIGIDNHRISLSIIHINNENNPLVILSSVGTSFEKNNVRVGFNTGNAIINYNDLRRGIKLMN